MTTTHRINRTVRTFNLVEQITGPLVKADMQKRGWDGSSWIGTAPAIGKLSERVVLFFRDNKGNFVAVV